ncbi:hypothetical protein AN958_08678 [Leucoagaricus sp. SymC.cos]|nr:hypothetical protein AN958_08678 [Leucoagaricus sp. SymC.cos]
MLAEEPRLQRYEDAWPVRFYLQHCVKNLEQPIPQTERQSDAATTNASTSAEMLIASGDVETIDSLKPSSLLVQCPIHILPDLSQVSEVIKTFFASNGMEELVVPLALNGITTERHFALLRSLDPTQREQLFSQKSHTTIASLNLFQSILLNILLRN